VISKQPDRNFSRATYTGHCSCNSSQTSPFVCPHGGSPDFNRPSTTKPGGGRCWITPNATSRLCCWKIERPEKARACAFKLVSTELPTGRSGNGISCELIHQTFGELLISSRITMQRSSPPLRLAQAGPRRTNVVRHKYGTWNATLIGGDLLF